MVPGSRTHGSGGTTRLHPQPTMKRHHSSPHRGCRGPACLALEMYTAGIFAASPSNHSSALPSFFTRTGPPPLAGAAGLVSARHSRHAATGTLAATGTHVTPQRTLSPPRAHSPPRALTSRLNGRTRRHRPHPLYWIVTDTSCVCPLRSIVMVTVSPAR